jgi:hypothetical protein
MILREPGKKKRGAPFGNRNAVKTGRYTARQRDLKRRIAAWRRKVRAVLSARAGLPLDP